MAEINKRRLAGQLRQIAVQIMTRKLFRVLREEEINKRLMKALLIDCPKCLQEWHMLSKEVQILPYLQCHGSNRHCKYGSNQEAGTVVEVITVHTDPNKGDESNNKIADLFEKSNLNTEYWNRLSQASPRMAYAFPKEMTQNSSTFSNNVITEARHGMIYANKKLNMDFHPALGEN
ncbi:hypothetical protein RHGRI_002429 [Rhododendron griersonianum]|uniref:Uncharacterized protein n=1 Tax=Rhododendron griersonianum TaxID=479676 RepID=A0AAV6LSN5_9ERIC|nr:hypothetical protein RHGRI_002429 [Rhododendron griersonianum]